MKSIGAPHLELGFYFPALAGVEALAQLFRYLTSHGATCDGSVMVNSGPGIRGQQFASITDSPGVSRKVANSHDVEVLLANEDVRVLQVMMHSPAFLHWSKILLLTQLSISPSCMHCDTHPIALWLDGSVLSHPRGKLPKKARRLGERTLEAFRLMVTSLNPAYATVTVDYGLECPCDIRVDPRTLAFQEFYLSEAFLGKKALGAVRRRAPSAYHEETQDGQLTCSTEWMSPDDRFLQYEEDAEDLSLFVGHLIASKSLREKQGTVTY